MKNNCLEIKISNQTKIAVVGDIHEHEPQFHEIVEKVNPSRNTIFVSVGDVYDKGAGLVAAEAITKKLQMFSELGYGYAVRGNHELKHLRKTEHSRYSDALRWWRHQPLALSFLYENGSRITIVHGGVRPSHTWEDLGSDVETSYIRDLDENGKMIRLKWIESNGKSILRPEKNGGQIWHKSYDGRFGYIASGHIPQKDGIVRFYNYSCNLDTACYQTGILSCQIFSCHGREQLIQVSGPAAKPLTNDD